MNEATERPVLIPIETDRGFGWVPGPIGFVIQDFTGPWCVDWEQGRRIGLQPGFVEQVPESLPA